MMSGEGATSQEAAGPSPVEVRQSILDLATSAFAFAALTATLELGLLEELSAPRSAAEIAQRCGVAEATVAALLDVSVAQGLVRSVAVDGRPAYACWPGMACLAAGRAGQFLLGDLRSTMLQGADLVERAGRRDIPTGGWCYSDTELLQAQGMRSAEGVSKLVSQLIPTLEGLDQRLRSPGANFLDVGTGVAAMAIEMCRQYPHLRVVGLDPFATALALARSNVARAALEARIELREEPIEELRDEGRFDLAWVPLMFLTPDVASRGLVRVLASLRPGGWTLASTIALGGEGLEPAVARLIALLWGSTGLLPHNGAGLMTAAGFDAVTVLPAFPGVAVRLIVGRRPMG